MGNDAKYDQIVVFNSAGVTNKEVVKHLKVCQKMVYYSCEQFQESGATSGKPIPSATRKTIISATKNKYGGKSAGKRRKTGNRYKKSQHLYCDG